MSPGQVDLGDTVLITVTATDNVGIAGTTLTVNGEPVFLVDNQASYTTTTAGINTAEATATDYAGLVGTDTTTFVVVDPGDTEPPEVTVSIPSDLLVKSPYELTGTISDPTLIGYSIEMAPIGSGNYFVMDEGSESVDNNVIGIIDPTRIENGLYDLRIRQ